MEATHPRLSPDCLHNPELPMARRLEPLTAAREALPPSLTSSFQRRAGGRDGSVASFLLSGVFSRCLFLQSAEVVALDVRFFLFFIKNYFNQMDAVQIASPPSIGPIRSGVGGCLLGRPLPPPASPSAGNLKPPSPGPK